MNFYGRVLYLEESKLKEAVRLKEKESFVDANKNTQNQPNNTSREETKLNGLEGDRKSESRYELYI